MEGTVHTLRHHTHTHIYMIIYVHIYAYLYLYLSIFISLIYTWNPPTYQEAQAVVEGKVGRKVHVLRLWCVGVRFQALLDVINGGVVVSSVVIIYMAGSVA